MSRGSEDDDRSPVASRRAAAAAAVDRLRRVKAKRNRRSPSYLSLRDHDRDRGQVVRRSRSRSRSRSPSPSRRCWRRYFDGRSPSPIRRRQSRSPSRRRWRRYFDGCSPNPIRRRQSRSPSPVRRRRACSDSDSDEEEPDRRGRSPRRGPAAPMRSCRSRSRTRSEECENRSCCSRSRSPPSDDGDGERSVSPPPEEDLYVRIDRSDDLFKCSHCFALLSSPVYECVDGHVTCAGCHGRTNDGVGEGGDERCSRCDSTDYRRSSAIAGWLKSILFPCWNHDYGCQAFLPRHNLDAHERSCHYAPVFCPADRRCDFFPGGPTDVLERHVMEVHGWTVVGVRYGEPVHVRARPGPLRSLLRAEDGALFYLCAKQSDHGSGASLSMIHIRPDDAPAAQFTYEVKTPPAAPGMQHRIQMQSTVWGTSLRDGVLYANPVRVTVPGSMLPTEGPEQDSVEVRIVKAAGAAVGDNVQRN